MAEMIDTKELRLLAEEFKSAGAPMIIQVSQINELLDRLEAAEKSDAESIAMYRKARDERDALRAKIEAMEKQEPVAWCATDETGAVVEALGMNQSRRFDTALYLAPGAKGEEK